VCVYTHTHIFRDYEEQCAYARLKWEDKCADIDKANKEAFDVAKAVWEARCDKIKRINERKQKVAEDEFARALAEVSARNAQFWQERLKHEAIVRDVRHENERRIARSERDYQDALARFEEEVGGEEAAAELLAGKAEWRENKWAWREYIDMINTATIDAGHLARLKRRVLEDRVTVHEVTLAQTHIDAQTVGAEQWEGDRPWRRARGSSTRHNVRQPSATIIAVPLPLSAFMLLKRRRSKRTMRVSSFFCPTCRLLKPNSAKSPLHLRCCAKAWYSRAPSGCQPPRMRRWRR